MTLLLGRIEVSAMRSIELVTRIAPLGLRFWDPVSEALVRGGLRVAAYPAGRPAQRVAAFANRSGTYVFTDLPDLRDVLSGADAAYWAEPPATRTFVVEVTDQEERFLPTTFTVAAPTRGAVPVPSVGSPPFGPPGIPLYSSPARVVPPGSAVVRATLQERANGDREGRPAAWAMVRVRLPDESSACGVADEQGRVSVVFAHPSPVLDAVHPPGSPPASAGTSLLNQQWRIDIEAAYDALEPPPTSDVLAVPPAVVIAGQTPRQLWADAAGTRPLGSPTLTFGKELVLRSVDPTKVPPERPQLFIEPPVTPP